MKHTGLFFEQILFLVAVSQLRRFDLSGYLWVDVVAVTDVVHPAAAA